MKQTNGNNNRQTDLDKCNKSKEEGERKLPESW